MVNSAFVEDKCWISIGYHTWPSHVTYYLFNEKMGWNNPAFFNNSGFLFWHVTVIMSLVSHSPVHPGRQRQNPLTGSHPSAWLQSQRSRHSSPYVPSCLTTQQTNHLV